MKICGLTQTYGNRFIEIDTLLKNNLKLDVMNSLDQYRINYHNSNLNETFNILFSSKCPKVNFKNYDNVPYGFTIFHTLNELKSNGFTDILFCQDDHYFIENEKVRKNLFTIIEAYKKNNPNILYLSSKLDKYIPYYSYKENDIIFEEYDCSKLDINEYGYSDSPYLAKIDFLLNNVYTKEKCHLSVWDVEVSSKNHFYNNAIKIQQAKCVGSYCANFSGRNVARVLSSEQKIQYILGNGDKSLSEIKQFYEMLNFN